MIQIKDNIEIGNNKRLTLIAGPCIIESEDFVVKTAVQIQKIVSIAGLFVETHPNPDKALSDAATQWPLSKLENLIDEVLVIDRVVKEEAKINV